MNQRMLEKELAVAREAAKAAGKALYERFGHVNHIMKKGEIDLVTEADLQAEKLILQRIRRAFPNDNILAEEAGKVDRLSNRTWLVDPLDGTTNYAHGFPFYAVSIALEIDSDISLGIVYSPHMNEYFEALKGKGAFLNERSIHASGTRSLREALMGTGFPYDVYERPKQIMAHFEKMLVHTQGVRRPGSAAIDLAYVAAGRLDGFWENGLHPWDMAAGALIVSEAGGKLSTMAGKPFNPYSESIVASNPHLHGYIIATLNG
jgi:myo-inositol-1(or 4)-monophosphatase